MKTQNSPKKLVGRMSARLKLGSWNLAVAALVCVGAQNAGAITETWTGTTSTNFNTATNYTGNVAPATGNVILFGTNAGTVPNQPTTFTSATVAALGFQGAGWTIGTVSGAGQTLTINNAATTLPGIGTGSYNLASTGAGTNEIAPNVVLSTTGAIFVDTGNTLKLDGSLTGTSTGNIAISGGGTLSVAGGYGGGGTAASSSTTVGLITDPGAGTATTFNLTGGAFNSPGSLIVGTASTLNIGAGVSTFTVGTTAAPLTLTVDSGATLTLANSGTTTFLTAGLFGGKLVFDNSTTVANRVVSATSTNSILMDGAEVQLIGNSASAVSQSVYLSITGSQGDQYAANTITLAPQGNFGVTLTNTGATQPTATTATGGTLLIRGTNLGASTGGFSNVLFTGVTPTTVSGLVPYAIGDTTGTTGQGNTFLSYNTTTGFTPATETTETIAAAATADNVVVASSDATQTGNKTINSLIVNGGGLTTTLTGTLTLASGDFAATSGATGSTLTGGTLAGPTNGRLYLFVEKGSTTGPDLTVNSTLASGTAGSTGMTKSGLGTLLLNTAVSGTGSIDVAQGTFMLGGANVLGTGNGSNLFYIGNNGTLDLNGNSMTGGATTTTALIGNSNNQQNQSGTITNSSATAATLTFNIGTTIYEHITGNIALVLNAGTLNLGVFNAAGSPLSNTFTGNVTANAGSTLTASDANLGAFTNTVFLNGGTFNPSNNVSYSAARNISVTTLGATLVADFNPVGLTDTFTGAIQAPSGTPTLTLQAGAATATAGLSSQLIFSSATANPLATSFNVVLNVANTGTATGLTTAFASSQALGSLATGAGANAADTVLGATAANVTFTEGGNNTSTTYNGAIANSPSGVSATGTVALVKNGTGTLTLSGNNSYSLGTTINAGGITLTGGSGAAVTGQTSTTTVSSNVITVGSTAGLAYGQPVSGTNIPTGSYVTSVTSGTTFTISQRTSTAGAGTGQAITFGAYSGLGTGAITVNGGTLTIGSANALTNNTSLLTVSGGTLTSSVAATTLGGNVAMTSGSITPDGASVGMLTLSANRTYSMSGGTLGLDLLTTGNYDQITGSGTGTFILTGGVLDLGGVTATAGNSYQILSGFASGTVSGISFTDYVAGDGSTPSLSNTGVLSFGITAVPEPSTWGAGVLVCVLLAGRQLLRRRHRLA